MAAFAPRRCSAAARSAASCAWPAARGGSIARWRAGADPRLNDALALRARAAGRPAHPRSALARGLRARRSPRLAAARRRRAASAARPCSRHGRRCSARRRPRRDPRPGPPRGVALALVLLTDGGGPAVRAVDVRTSSHAARRCKRRAARPMVTMPRGATTRCSSAWPPGVGKTYRMLQEGHAELENGRDVVIGLLETHGRAETAALADGLELLPRRRVAYRDTSSRRWTCRRSSSRAPRAVPDRRARAHQRARASSTPSATRTSRTCWTPASTCSPRVNVQHLESLNDRSPSSAACACARPSPTRCSARRRGRADRCHA